MVCMAGLSVAHERSERDILPDPMTWEEAMLMPDWKVWRKAGCEERHNLKAHHTFLELTLDEIEDLQLSGVTIHMYKCRCSLRGFTQREHYYFHKTFAAVASSGIMRLIIALAVCNGLTIHHLDVVGAYLYSPMAEELYMWAAPGVHNIYGARQACANWSKHWIKVLKEFGFVAANAEETVLVMIDPQASWSIILCLYVAGDSLACKNWPSKYNALLQFIKKKIEITDTCDLQWHLSVRYQWSADKQLLFASQTAYIEKVAAQHGVDPNLEKGQTTQMSEKFEVLAVDITAPEDVDPELRTKTKSLMGSVLFPAGWCCPDMCHTMIKIARQAHQLSDKVYDAALRALEHLVVTKRD
eukprot:3485486-Rhodomonas_salina.3